MASTNISQYKEWNDLIRALKDNPQLSFISTAPIPVQKKVLAAPLAISTFISRYTPQLCNLEKINIMVIGAEWFDAMDNGRWYQSIADFCDSSFKVGVTLVGPYVFSENNCKTMLSSAVKIRYPEAVIIKSRLEDAKIDLSSFDLFVFFQQGIESHQREWMKGALPFIVKTGKPILATTFHRDAYAMDVKQLEKYGYSVEAEPIENAFFVEYQGNVSGVLKWGHILYKIKPEILYSEQLGPL